MSTTARVDNPIVSLRVRFAVATALGLLAIWLGGGWHPVASSAQGSSTQSPRLYGIGKARFSPISSASCAAAACHGGGRVGEKGSEHTTWSPNILAEEANDPHAKAYRVLFNPDSARIGKILGIAAPHKEGLCLKCHAVDGVLPQGGVSDGVGCSACHGHAEKWI
ncbi:MAG TPA: multiheme c-type cytochrome, partial [Gemmata sp.]|nr:multiheme c-type cytochrome [Gemmata sp.]